MANSTVACTISDGAMFGSTWRQNDRPPVPAAGARAAST